MHFGQVAQSATHVQVFEILESLKILLLLGLVCFMMTIHDNHHTYMNKKKIDGTDCMQGWLSFGNEI